MKNFSASMSFIAYLLKRDTIVFQEQESIIPNSGFHLGDKSVDNSWIIGIHFRELDDLELGEIVNQLGDRRRVPLWNEGFAFCIWGRWAEFWCGWHIVMKSLIR